MNNMNQRIFDLLESTNLNWNVSKEPLISSIDNAQTNAYGVFKQTSRQFLGAVGERYSVMQNHQLAESLLLASDNIGVTFTRGGELNRGQRVYLQAQLPDEHIGKSDIKRYITALNSHDGSTAISFGSSNTVVICNNTFFRAYRAMSKFKHSINALERIKDLANDMNKAILSDTRLIDNFKLMDSTPLKDEWVQKVINKVFDVEHDALPNNLSTRKKNQIDSFVGALDTEIKLEGNTAWGLFNAVTRYTNHISAPKSDVAKTDYIMNGNGYKLSNMTYELLMEIIDDKAVAYN
jgi:hypothetical protein